MVFSSLEFIFRFLPIFLVLYFLTPKPYRNVTLLLGSLCFYALGEPGYLILILLSVMVNYGLGRKMGKENDKAYIKNGKKVYRENYRPGRKKCWFLLGIFYNLGMLFVFKYAGFFTVNVNRVLTYAGSFSGVEVPLLPVVKLALPLGISFYTFQILSYLIDVYLEKVEWEKSLVSLGTYLVMFPQLIAGPIVVYSGVQKQLTERSCSLQKFEVGLRYFVMGLGSKVLLANRIGSLWHEVQTIGYESISTPLAWLGAAAYSFQIYFDFQGYSLMAIGLGRMLGFRLPKNFNHPYTSKTLTEFWQRWHITLGSWFRDYVYIPLGGNRAGKWKMFRNLFIVWFLTGLWHGAEWNFILWGMVLFLIMSLEKAGLKNFLDKHVLLARIYMGILIPVTWMLFAISGISQVTVYLERMFPFFGIQPGACVNSSDYIRYLVLYAPLFIICLFFSTDIPERLYRRGQKSTFMLLFLWGVFLFSLYFLATAANNPFLYFRF